MPCLCCLVSVETGYWYVKTKISCKGRCSDFNRFHFFPSALRPLFFFSKRGEKRLMDLLCLKWCQSPALPLDNECSYKVLTQCRISAQYEVVCLMMALTFFWKLPRGDGSATISVLHFHSWNVPGKIPPPPTKPVNRAGMDYCMYESFPQNVCIQ